MLPKTARFCGKCGREAVDSNQTLQRLTLEAQRAGYRSGAVSALAALTSAMYGNTSAEVAVLRFREWAANSREEGVSAPSRDDVSRMLTRFELASLDEQGQHIVLEVVAWVASAQPDRAESRRVFERFNRLYGAGLKQEVSDALAACLAKLGELSLDSSDEAEALKAADAARLIASSGHPTLSPALQAVRSRRRRRSRVLLALGLTVPVVMVLGIFVVSSRRVSPPAIPNGGGAAAEGRAPEEQAMGTGQSAEAGSGAARHGGESAQSDAARSGASKFMSRGAIEVLEPEGNNYLSITMRDERGEQVAVWCTGATTKVLGWDGDVLDWGALRVGGAVGVIGSWRTEEGEKVLNASVVQLLD